MKNKVIKILIVEDNEVIATGIKTMLNNEGFKTYICNNIETAK